MIKSQTSHNNLTSERFSNVQSMSDNIKPVNVMPMVVETSGFGERAFDIYSRLLRERIIFMGTAIDDKVADSIVAQLLYLEAEDPDIRIFQFISIPPEARFMQDWQFLTPCSKSFLMCPQSVLD
jgi:ATP-dependent Clp protease, protease subunit